LADIVQSINSIIATRTRYGVRTEKFPSGDYSVLCWSNCLGWLIYADWASEPNYNHEKELHAQEIVVPFSREEVKPILEKLDPLPLHKNSLEYKYGKNIFEETLK